MSELLQSFVSKSTFVKVIISLAILLVVNFFINGKLIGLGKLKEITNGVGILDMEFGYSVDKAYGILDALGSQGRAFYLRMIPMDFVFPLSYMLFYLAAISYLLRLSNLQGRLLNYALVIPVLTAAFDFIENTAIIRLLRHYPVRLINTAKIANVLTMTKIVFIYMSMGTIALLLIATLFIKLRTIRL